MKGDGRVDCDSGSDVDTGKVSMSKFRRRAGSDARARSANVSGSSSRRSSINQLMSAVRRWSTPNISPLAKKLKELLKQLDKAAPSVGPGGKASRRMSASVEKSVVQKIHDELFANPEVSNYADMTDVHIFLQCWRRLLDIVDSIGHARQELYYGTILLLMHRPELRCDALVYAHTREETELRRTHDHQIMTTFKYATRKLSRKRTSYSEALTSFATAVVGYVYFCMPSVSSIILTRMSRHIEELRVNTPTEDPTCLWECAALAASVKDYAAKFNYRTSDLGKQRSELSSSPIPNRLSVDSLSPRAFRQVHSPSPTRTTQSVSQNSSRYASTDTFTGVYDTTGGVSTSPKASHNPLPGHDSGEAALGKADRALDGADDSPEQTETELERTLQLIQISQSLRTLVDGQPSIPLTDYSGERTQASHERAQTHSEDNTPSHGDGTDKDQRDLLRSGELLIGVSDYSESVTGVHVRVQSPEGTTETGTITYKDVVVEGESQAPAENGIDSQTDIPATPSAQAHTTPCANTHLNGLDSPECPSRTMSLNISVKRGGESDDSSAMGESPIVPKAGRSVSVLGHHERSGFSESSASSREDLADQVSSHRRTSKGPRPELSWLLGKSASSSHDRRSEYSKASRKGSKSKPIVEGLRTTCALLADSPLLVEDNEIAGEWVDRLIDNNCSLFFLVAKEVFLYVNVKRRRADFIPPLTEPSSVTEDFFAIPGFSELISCSAFLLARKSSVLPTPINDIATNDGCCPEPLVADDDDDGDLWPDEALYMMGELSRCFDAVDLMFNVVFVRTNLRDVEHVVGNLIFLGDWVQTLRDNSGAPLRQLDTDALCGVLQILLEEEHYLVLQYTVMFLVDVLPAIEGHLHARVSAFVLDRYWEKLMYHWSVHVRGLFQHYLVYGCVPSDNNKADFKRVLQWTDGFMCKHQGHTRLTAADHAAPQCVSQYRALTKFFAQRMLSLRIHHEPEHACFAGYEEGILRRVESDMSLCNRLRDVAHTYAHIAEKELQFTLCRAIEWCDAQEGDTKMRAPPPERTDTSIIAT